jgi:hypothetical protein
MSEKKDPKPIIQEIRENIPVKANFERCFEQGSFKSPKKPKINDVIADDSTDIIKYYIRDTYTRGSSCYCIYISRNFLLHYPYIIL